MKKKYSNLAVLRLVKLFGFNVVLEGGPSCGKSTQIELLVDAGFIVLPEMASILIQQAKLFAELMNLTIPDAAGKADAAVVKAFNENGIFHPFVNNAEFQVALAEGQLGQEKPFAERLVKVGAALDRSALSIPVYCEHYGVAVPENIKSVTPKWSERIDLCFMLKSFGGFENNGIRLEGGAGGADFAKEIGDKLTARYFKEGVKVIEVETMQRATVQESIDARHDFIWKSICDFAEAKLKELGK